jgi:DNA modification methylase
VNYNSNSKFEYIQQIIPFLPYLIEQVVWKKSSAIPLKGCMRRAWEPVYIFSNTRKNLGTEVVETNIWEISNTHSQGEDHKACFPVGLPAKGISLVKPKTGIVLEPFGGTGTAIIAAEQLGRKCYMMELDPHYCDVIIARWEKLTGKKAIKLTK